MREVQLKHLLDTRAHRPEAIAAAAAAGAGPGR